MIKPNFIIIGAAKSGTTALYEYLKKHPEVYMTPMKEPNFFSLENHKLVWKEGTVGAGYVENFVYDYNSYIRLFEDAKNKTAIGEASPIYLYDPEAAETIYRYLPKIKLIVILRNPAERAFSNFVHHLRGGLETTRNFNEALDLEEKRIMENWWWGFYYKNAGFYYQQLIRYYNVFPPDQIKVIVYDEWLEDPEMVYRDILDFLGVYRDFVPDLTKKYKVSSLVKNEKIESIIKGTGKLFKLTRYLFPVDQRDKVKQFVNERIRSISEFNRYKPVLDNETRSFLIKEYKKDIMSLEKLIKRDLTKWYS